MCTAGEQFAWADTQTHATKRTSCRPLAPPDPTPTALALTSSLIATFCAGIPRVVSNMCVVMGLRPPPPAAAGPRACAECGAAACIDSWVWRCPPRWRLMVLVRRAAAEELGLCMDDKGSTLFKDLPPSLAEVPLLLEENAPNRLFFVADCCGPTVTTVTQSVAASAAELARTRLASAAPPLHRDVYLCARIDRSVLPRVPKGYNVEYWLRVSALPRAAKGSESLLVESDCKTSTSAPPPRRASRLRSRAERIRPAPGARRRRGGAWSTWRG